MTRAGYAFWRLLLYPTRLHLLCGIIAVLCCVPILFPYICPADMRNDVIGYAGASLLFAQSVSTAFMILAVVIHMLRLSNTRAFSQLFKWMAVWGSCVGIFVILAIAADVPPPGSSTSAQPIQASDTLHPARDQLNGPASLVIPIEPASYSAEVIVDTPNLSYLEENHEELFKYYVSTSPRWSSQDGDDTFYSKPGHLVMVPPTHSGPPSLVHVCFRRLVEGDPLPKGYEVVKPGDRFPEIDENRPQIPDIALDLGRNHLLLLAWRGSEHRETACKAINAAIAATDTRMQPLRDEPTPETVQRMLQGRESYPGTTPELRLSEPLAQEGAYQAEIYANPGEQGTILVYIKDLATHKTLRLLSCPAHFSDNPEELFRHDIPGSLPHWIRSADEDDISNIFPHNTPLFAIRRSTQHRYFGVAFEVWFKPTDVRRNRHMLLRRCYKVQSYDPPVGLDTEEPRAEQENTMHT